LLTGIALNRNLKAELAKLKAEHEKLSQKVDYLESEKQGLEAEVGLLGQLAHAQTSNVRATVMMDQVYMKLRLEVEAYKDRAETEMKLKKTKEAEVAKLESQLKDIQAQLESQGDELDQVNLKYRRAKDDIRHYRNRIDKMRKDAETAADKESGDSSASSSSASSTAKPTTETSAPPSSSNSTDNASAATPVAGPAPTTSADKPAAAPKPKEKAKDGKGEKAAKKTTGAKKPKAADKTEADQSKASSAPAAAPVAVSPVSPRDNHTSTSAAPPPPPAPPAPSPAATTSSKSGDAPRSALFDQIKNTNNITLKKADERLQKLAEKPVDVNDESALKIIAAALISRRNAMTDQGEDDDTWDED
jgi:peptidoglycan hydrolase CwlO-like protein